MSTEPNNEAPKGKQASPTERSVYEKVRPQRPGDAVVRVRRPQFKGFTRRGRGHLEAGIELEQPRGAFGAIRRILVGEPLHGAMESHERLSKKKAIAVFSSDALSSVAYAPQEVLVVLLGAGVAALIWSLPISIAVIVLLAIVITSYRQTIYAYPKGGGSYIVAHTNLGQLPGLIAASALATGYILTVAVSVASSIDQLISAVQVLGPYRVWLGVGAIALVTLVNLRGISESGSVFAIPTYVFLFIMYALIGTGLYLLWTGQLVVPPPLETEHTVEQAFGLALLLRAFATGSAVMTGTEAISDGVQAFEAPESKNAAHTLLTMAGILTTMFLGLAFLIAGSGVIPSANETVLSQLGRAVFGEGPFYWVLTASSVLILVLAANTAFADFPRLFSFLARDDYAPHQLAFRGDRLAFSNGILMLGILSALLVIAFSGATGALLPLYALSVFLAFTFSQSGMVAHWIRNKGEHWQLKASVNGVGATATAVVALTAAVTNFVDVDHPIIPGTPIGWGAWLVLVIVPTFIWLFMKVKKHYLETAEATRLPLEPTEEPPLRHVVVVPISRLNRPTIKALKYAVTLSTNVTAVHIGSDADLAAALEADWDTWGRGVPLVIVESPFRSLSRPLLSFLTELKRNEGADIVTVVLPEYVPISWWEHILHGQSAQFLKLSLLFTPGFVVSSVPTLERDTKAEARTSA